MAKLRYEINILNGVETGAGGTHRVLLDTSQYYGAFTTSRTYTFEVVAKDTDGTGSGSVYLTRSTGEKDATITVSATTPTRSRQTFTPPAGATEYYLESQAVSTIYSARIIVTQTATRIDRSESQIEVGGTQTSTSTTAVALTYPKYFKYVASEWDGNKSFYFEASFLTGTSKSAATVKLQVADGTGDGFTGWADVTNTTLTTISTTGARVRGSSAFTPVDGRWYRITITAGNSKSGITIYNAKVIVQQNNYTLMEGNAAGSGNLAGPTGDTGTLQRVGQSFLTTSAYNLAAVGVKLGITGTPTDNIQVLLRSGSVGGTLVDASHSIPAGEAKASFLLTILPFTYPPSLSNATTYYLNIKRSGANSGTTYWRTLLLADDYLDGENFRDDSGTWTSAGGDCYFATYSLTSSQGITKCHEEWLVANTLLASGTALQNLDTYFDPDEWSGVTNTYKHQLEAANGSTSDAKLQSDPNGTPADVTNSTVTDPDNGGQSSAMTMPGTAKEIDVICTTNNNDIYASRILAAVVVDTGPQGTLSVTLGDATLASTGTVATSGVLSKTLDAVTSTATGAVDVAGASSVTLAGITLSGAGTVDIVGTLEKTLDATTLSSTGTVGAATIEGTLSVTLDAATLSSAGTVEIAGTLSKTLDDATLSSAGAVEVQGTASPTLADATLSSAGTVDLSGVLSKTLDDTVLAGTGAVDVVGTLSKTLADTTLESTGVVGSVPVEGTLSVTLDAVTLTGAGTVDVAGVLSKTLDDATLSSAGTVSVSGTASVTLDNTTISSAGVVEIICTLSKTLDAVTLVATGTTSTVEILGTLSQTLEDAVLSSTGTVPVGGSLSKTLSDLEVTSSGEVVVRGSLDATLASLTCSATATLLLPILPVELTGTVVLVTRGSVGVSSRIARNATIRRVRTGTTGLSQMIKRDADITQTISQ